jgi:hypothetical protein
VRQTFTTCQAGTYNPTTGSCNSSSCVRCAAGKANPIPGSTSPEVCLDCLPGSFAALPGTAVCTLCPAGKIQARSGATACDTCTGGHFCPHGAPAQLPCRKGTYSNAPGLAHADDCTTCPLGASCSTGATAPMDCLPGSRASQTSMHMCQLCPAGKFTRDSGSTACRLCTAGYLCVEGSSAPQPCPGGTHADQSVLATVGFLSNLTSHCIDCPDGTFCAIGALQPENCSTGTYNADTAATECRQCHPGEYQSEPGQSSCSICPVGSYSTNILSCEPCQVGEYCMAGATVGERCPTDFTTVGRGASSSSDCGCFDGLYETTNAGGMRICVSCPDASTQCDKTNTKLEALPLAQGFWRQSTDAIDIRPCFTPSALRLLRASVDPT